MFHSFANIRYSYFNDKTFFLATDNPLFCFRSVTMRNNFGEIESPLSVLLVHVQKNMVEQRLASSTTGTVQQSMLSLKNLMKENEEAKARQDLTLEERLEVKNIEEQIEIAQAKLTEMMMKKTEETKEGKDKDSKSKLMEDYDTGTNVQKIQGTDFDFIENIFPKL